jgi:hypothetical protein
MAPAWQDVADDKRRQRYSTYPVECLLSQEYLDNLPEDHNAIKSMSDSAMWTSLELEYSSRAKVRGHARLVQVMESMFSSDFWFGFSQFQCNRCRIMHLRSYTLCLSDPSFKIKLPSL